MDDDARNAVVIAVAALIVGEVVVRLLDGAGPRGTLGLVIGGPPLVDPPLFWACTDAISDV